MRGQLGRAIAVVAAAMMEAALLAGTPVPGLVAPAPPAAAAAKAPGAKKTPRTFTWAGHQMMRGKKRVAIVGTVSTRSDTFLVATAVERENGISILQQPCRVIFKKTAGVKTSMRSQRPDFMPRATVEFIGLRGGWMQALPWVADWKSKDLDADGRPGVTVDVESFFCSGEIWITNRSESVARGHFVGDRFEGVLRSSVRQKVLGASNACLTWAITEREDRMQGRFLYVPVPEGSTCESLLGKPWPGLAAPLEE